MHQNNVCFFCGARGGKDSLHIAYTMNLDTRIRKVATTLEDRTLLDKLGTTDLVAQDAQDHTKCLTALDRRERKTHKSSTSEADHESEKKALSPT